MAVQSVLGGELAWVADNDPGAALILTHHYPDVPNLGDITAVDWAAVDPVDILTGGFPCQDVSAAGARAGLHAGTRSGVWAHCARAIGALRPRLVVIENVRGLLTARGDEPTPEHLADEAARDIAFRLLEWQSRTLTVAIAKGDTRRVIAIQARAHRLMGYRKRIVARCQWHERRLVRAIGTVLGDLAGLGYDTQWCCVPAADAGAPHRRERVFILATNTRGGELQRRRNARVLGSAQAGEPGEGDQRERARDTAGDSSPAVAADPGGERRDGRPGISGPGGPATLGEQAVGDGGHSSHASAEDPDRATGDQRWFTGPGETEGGRPRADTGRPGGTPTPADTTGDGRDEGRPEPARLIRGSDAAVSGDGSPADTCSEGLVVRAVEHHGPERPATERGGGDAPADPDGQYAGSDARGGGGTAPAGAGDGQERRGEPGPSVRGGTPADTDSAAGGRHEPRRGPGPLQGTAVAERAPEQPRRLHSGSGDQGTMAPADTDGRGLTEHEERDSRTDARLNGSSLGDDTFGRVLEWGNYAPAIRRWEAVLGRSAPPPTEPGRTGQRLSPAFVEWLMGLPEGWVTGVPGLSRNAQLKALGNGVVPAQAAMALHLLLARTEAQEAA